MGVCVWRKLDPETRAILEAAEASRPSHGWGKFASRTERCLLATINGEIRRSNNREREADIEAVAWMKSTLGRSNEDIADDLGLSKVTVARILRELDAERMVGK